MHMSLLHQKVKETLICDTASSSSLSLLLSRQEWTGWSASEARGQICVAQICTGSEANHDISSHT